MEEFYLSFTKYCLFNQISVLWSFYDFFGFFFLLVFFFFLLILLFHFYFFTSGSFSGPGCGGVEPQHVGVSPTFLELFPQIYLHLFLPSQSFTHTDTLLCTYGMRGPGCQAATRETFCIIDAPVLTLSQWGAAKLSQQSLTELSSSSVFLLTDRTSTKNSRVNIRSDASAKKAGIGWWTHPFSLLHTPSVYHEGKEYEMEMTGSSLRKTNIFFVNPKCDFLIHNPRRWTDVGSYIPSFVLVYISSSCFKS